MGTFRTLINEFRSQSDKERRFLIDHGIDPKALLIPMYYPDKDFNVVLQGPSKESPWFSNDEIVSPKDKVIVKHVFERYVAPGDENDTGNYYNKETGESIELTVDEYKEKILNNLENEETQYDMKFDNLDTGEYQIDDSTITITNAGIGYNVNDELILDCDKGDAILVVSEVDPSGAIKKLGTKRVGYSTARSDEPQDLVPSANQYNAVKGTGAKVSTKYAKDKGIANSLYNLKRNSELKKEKIKDEFKKFANLLIHIGSGKLLNDLNIPEDKEGNIKFDSIPESTKLAIEKLHSLYKQGVDMNDEYAFYVVWEARNHILFDAIKEKIKGIKNENQRGSLQSEFKKKKKQWFRSNLDPKTTAGAANDWWKSLGLSPLSAKKKTEAVLTEFGRGKSNTYIPYTDAAIDKYLDATFGDNGKRFKTVPIVNIPYNPDDPDADPVEYYLIRGIDAADADENYKLRDNGKVRVAKTNEFGAKPAGYETFEMNVDDLKEIIDREENVDSRLDTDARRRQSGSQLDTLNPGYGGKDLAVLQPDLIRYMLKTMQEDEDGDYRHDYTMIDLVKKYEEELKDPSKHSKIILDALNDFNDEKYKQYTISYYPSENCYKGRLEYEGHIIAAKPHTWRGMVN